MSRQAYGNEKALWHLGKIAALRRGTQIVPAQVQLILSDLCSHGCRWCGYRRPDGLSSEQFGVYEHGQLNMNPNRMIPAAKAIEILNDCAALGVKAVQFTGGGSPTLHPQCMEIFGHAQSLGLETALVTNGTLLRPGWETIYPAMAWVRVSIDAGRAETYGTIRQIHPSFFAKALHHVSLIRQAIDRKGSPCLLGAGYVITMDNWQELPEGVRLIKESGAHNVRLSAMFSTQGDRYYEDAIPAIEDMISKAMSYQDSTFHVVDMFGDRITDLQQAPDYAFCGYEQFNMYIGGNLKIYRCCTTAYTLHGEVGDLSNQRLLDWFASAQKREAYGTFDARSCQVCQFNGKNRAILYAIDPAPTHVNFV